MHKNTKLMLQVGCALGIGGLVLLYVAGRIGWTLPGHATSDGAFEYSSGKRSSWATEWRVGAWIALRVAGVSRLRIFHCEPRRSWRVWKTRLQFIQTGRSLLYATSQSCVQREGLDSVCRRVRKPESGALTSSFELEDATVCLTVRG